VLCIAIMVSAIGYHPAEQINPSDAPIGRFGLEVITIMLAPSLGTLSPLSFELGRRPL
jgi:hypothetical protein